MSEKKIDLEVPRFHDQEKLKKLPNATRHTKIFKAIVEFAEQLNDAFGKEDVNIKKVYHLLYKTQITNRKVVERHLVIFQDFLLDNRPYILERNSEDFEKEDWVVTERIKVNLKDTIMKADSATQKIIWQHFFNIMFLFDPEDERVKNELKVSVAENETRENKFLKDTFSKFEEVMKNPANAEQKDPMAMMGGLLQSGFLNDMIGSINNGVSKGDLNIKNLISTVQSLLGNLSETIDREEKLEKSSSAAEAAE